MWSAAVLRNDKARLSKLLASFSCDRRGARGERRRINCLQLTIILFSSCEPVHR